LPAGPLRDITTVQEVPRVLHEEGVKLAVREIEEVWAEKDTMSVLKPGQELLAVAVIDA
jgi:hypothetical protein